MRKELKSQYQIKIGNMLKNAEQVLNLREGEINAHSVAEMAGLRKLPVLLIVTDELAGRDDVFTHNAGTRLVGVSFKSSKAFYQAHSLENPQVKFVDAKLPGVVILPA